MNDYENDYFPAGTLAMITIDNDYEVLAMRRYMEQINRYDWAVSHSGGGRGYSCYSDDGGITNVNVLDIYF